MQDAILESAPVQFLINSYSNKTALTMADLTPFSSITDAIMKGQQAGKGSFILETGMDGNTVSDDEKNYL